MTCTCKAILTGNGLHIGGFEPVSNFRKVAKEPWVEVPCARPDDHPVNGSEHWHEQGCVRISWTITDDAIWQAI